MYDMSKKDTEKKKQKEECLYRGSVSKVEFPLAQLSLVQYLHYLNPIDEPVSVRLGDEYPSPSRYSPNFVMKIRGSYPVRYNSAFTHHPPTALHPKPSSPQP
jgi:hypothetical protein